MPHHVHVQLGVGAVFPVTKDDTVEPMKTWNFERIKEEVRKPYEALINSGKEVNNLKEITKPKPKLEEKQMNKIIIGLMIAIIVISGGILKAEEEVGEREVKSEKEGEEIKIKDYDYYAKEYEEKGCDVIKEWEREPNYKEILKTFKIENEWNEIDYLIPFTEKNIGVLIVSECLKKSYGEQKNNPKGYKWEIIANDKELLMLTNQSMFFTDPVRNNDAYVMRTESILGFFKIYYPNFKVRGKELIELKDVEVYRYV